MNLFRLRCILSVLLFSLAPFFSQAQNILYVDSSSEAVSPTGTSWISAFSSLQDAITASKNNSAVQQIWVKKGTYYPSVYPPETNNTDVRNSTFYLKPGVALYGGFNGTETSLAQRDFRRNQTILSGDIGVKGNSLDNCYHVVLAMFANPQTRLDGFTVRDGRADLDWSYYINTRAVNNDLGGGLYAALSGMVVTNCLFTNNYAIDGAGLFTFQAPLVSEITNCIFANNTTRFNGAGIYVIGNTNDRLSPANCVFYGNTGYRGAVSCAGANLQVANCTFANNTGTAQPAYPHLYSGNNGTLTVTNSILWGSTNMENLQPDFITVTNSLIQYGHPGTGNVDADPLFNDYSNGIGPDNIWGTSDDGLHLRVGSPAVNGGDNTAVPANIIDDISGQARIRFNVVDMGAYEDSLGVLPLHLLSFSARKNNNGVWVQWKTTGEEYTDLFQIERSYDGRLFTIAGNVASQNKPGNHAYSFYDADANGLHTVVYYRLKMVDIDGRFTHSSIASVSYTGSTDEIKLYPNPVATRATLELRLEQPDHLQVQLVNNAGQIVRTFSFEVSAGTTLLPLTVSGCPAGVYYVKIKGSRVEKWQKISVR
jgi:hypothetical protein